MLSDEYIAGFFDGEGCINITVRGKNSNPSLRVYLMNTNREILDAIRQQYPRGNLYVIDHSSKPGWKNGNQLVFHGRFALDFLLSIKPYVILKREQILLAEEFWAWTHRPRKERCQRIPGTGRALFRIDPEIYAVDHAFKQRMHGLNKKGPSTAV